VRIFLAQIFGKFIQGENDYHDDDGGKTNGIVRNREHIVSPPVKLDEETLNKVKAE
jgi:hypothetical protein